jgi:hypothetical protein
MGKTGILARLAVALEQSAAGRPSEGKKRCRKKPLLLESTPYLLP